MGQLSSPAPYWIVGNKSIDMKHQMAATAIRRFSQVATQVAGKRTSQTSINWADLAKRIPVEQKAAFESMRNQHFEYLRQVNALPADLPAIDWEYYRSKIAIPGMVDDFEKKYKALDIPYPENKWLHAFDAEYTKKKAEFDQMCVESNEKIAESEKGLERWTTMRPIEEMSKEEVLLQCYDVRSYSILGNSSDVLGLVVDPNAPPTFWPHFDSYEQDEAHAMETKEWWYETYYLTGTGSGNKQEFEARVIDNKLGAETQKTPQVHGTVTSEQWTNVFKDSWAIY